MVTIRSKSIWKRNINQRKQVHCVVVYPYDLKVSVYYEGMTDPMIGPLSKEDILKHVPYMDIPDSIKVYAKLRNDITEIPIFKILPDIHGVTVFRERV